MEPVTVGRAAAATGWSARMLRYLEDNRLVVPSRTNARYRLYGLRELNQLQALRRLRSRFGLELHELAFAARLRRERALREAVDAWLATAEVRPTDWVDWEQRKHERLLAA
jgi:DNA-binding transcriptional MerR regulator